VALRHVLNRKFASAVLLLLLVENLRSAGALGVFQWYEVHRVSWKSAMSCRGSSRVQLDGLEPLF
jgi:hypothetical protein